MLISAAVGRTGITVVEFGEKLASDSSGIFAEEEILREEINAGLVGGGKGFGFMVEDDGDEEVGVGERRETRTIGTRTERKRKFEFGLNRGKGFMEMVR